MPTFPGVDMCSPYMHWYVLYCIQSCPKPETSHIVSRLSNSKHKYRLVCSYSLARLYELISSKGTSRLRGQENLSHSSSTLAANLERLAASHSTRSTRLKRTTLEATLEKTCALQTSQQAQYITYINLTGPSVTRAETNDCF